MGQSLQPGYLLLDKEDEKEVNPFDLKPVISNLMDEPKIPMASNRTGMTHIILLLYNVWCIDLNF